MNDWIKFVYIAHCRYGVRFSFISKSSYSIPNIIYMEALSKGVKMKLESEKIIKNIIRYRKC